MSAFLARLWRRALWYVRGRHWVNCPVCHEWNRADGSICLHCQWDRTWAPGLRRPFLRISDFDSIICLASQDSYGDINRLARVVRMLNRECRALSDRVSDLEGSRKDRGWE